MKQKAVVCLAGVFLLVGVGCHQMPQPPSRMITPFDGIVVLPDVPAVEIQAWTCLDGGWLEQIACSPATREHESLVVIEPRPSEIHAAMLLAGFQPGSPGKWSYDNDALEFTPPTGDRLDVFVRYESPSGVTIEEPIRNWVQDHLGRAQFPDDPWVFGGSAFSPNPQGMDPGEQYVADMTGSIIGLVTFGDEVIGFSRVWADQQAVQTPQWQVRSEHLPPVGTPVTLILRRVPGNDTTSP